MLPTIPLVMISLGEAEGLGNTPRGCPEYMTRVCSSVSSDRYCITSQNWWKKVGTYSVTLSYLVF